MITSLLISMTYQINEYDRKYDLLLTFWSQKYSNNTKTGLINFHKTEKTTARHVRQSNKTKKDSNINKNKSETMNFDRGVKYAFIMT